MLRGKCEICNEQEAVNYREDYSTGERTSLCNQCERYELKIKQVKAICMKCDEKYIGIFKFGICRDCKQSEDYKFNLTEYSIIK